MPDGDTDACRQRRKKGSDGALSAHRCAAPPSTVNAGVVELEPSRLSTYIKGGNVQGG
jgi:hypothetical protein